MSSSSPSLLSSLPAAVPAGAQRVPDSMRASLIRYGNIMERATKDGAFWRCARDEQRSSARMLAERLFGVMVPEEAALEYVRFSAGFEECWLAEGKGNRGGAEAQRGEG